MSIRILEVWPEGARMFQSFHIVGVTLREKAPFTGPDIHLDKFISLPSMFTFASNNTIC
jgi:hypothetical protein